MWKQLVLRSPLQSTQFLLEQLWQGQFLQEQLTLSPVLLQGPGGEGHAQGAHPSQQRAALPEEGWGQRSDLAAQPQQASK